MKKLSARFDVWWRSHDQTQLDLPFVVVGSGYGGSVAAMRLAEAGHDVTLLEKGSEFLPGDFPNDFSSIPAYIRGPSLDGTKPIGAASGHIELRVGQGVTSVVGNGLGGGSLINAGVLIEPTREVLSDESWPDEIRHNVDELRAYFELARTELGGKPWSGTNSKSCALERYACGFRNKESGKDERIAAAEVILTIDEDKCTECGDCASGCNVEGAKLTLRDTYLARAKKAELPARILTGATVYSVQPDSEGKNAKWKIRVVPTEAIARFRSLQEAAELEPEGAGVEVTTDTLILSAGTFGTVEILQRSKNLFGAKLPLSPALGSRFSTNGDALSFSADETNNVDSIGVGADAWRQQSGTDKVGPTITRSIDLRRGREMANQYLIQDGAIPGAIVPVFDIMLSMTFEMNQIAQKSWRYPESQGAEQFSFGDLTRSLQINENPSNSLARRTQTLLTMGHDGSRGQIVWVEKMDCSVPYWDDPEKVKGYAVQAREMQQASAKVGGLWLPSLLWQPIPDAMSDIMSGPLPDKMLTTVHPLGGCVMGSDPRTSVVDQFGRAWQVSSVVPNANDKYESLYILDGSIIPTSLGCNPLLTITAIAERASEKSLLQRQPNHQSSLPREPIPDSTYSADVFHRSEPRKMPAYLEERLVAANFSSPPEFKRLFGDLTIDVAELQLELATENWNEMWANRQHPLEVSGTLRLGSGSSWINYKAKRTAGSARLFEASAPPRGFPCSLLWCLGNISSVVRVFFTWALLRPREFCKRRKEGEKKKLDWRAMVRYMWHATEVRKMDYDVIFEKSSQMQGPKTLILKGSKHIEYPASWWQIYRYLSRKIRQQDCSKELVLRQSFFEQASHLNVQLEEGSGLIAENLFQMDFTYLVERLPVRMSGGGDLPSAMVELMRYPLVFSQYLLKTRIFDFRLPDYSGCNLVDSLSDDDNEPEENRWLRIANSDEFVKPTVLSFTVPQGQSSFDLPDDEHVDMELKLLRYARPKSEDISKRIYQGDWYGQKVLKVKSILLTHAFAQSGYSYTFGTTEQNMAEHFYEKGYEVWIIEHRISTSVPAHRQQSTVDQIGEFDIPMAVDQILGKINEDLKCKKKNPDALPVQFYSFAQCIGGAASAMALLSGRLSYSNISQVLEGDDEPVLLPKLAGLVISQTHPHCIGQPMTRAKTWIPSMLRDAVGLSHLPLAVRGAQDSLVNALFDRVCNALPVPEEELCPQHFKLDEDDCATCKRIRFLEAPLFKHRNLNDETHRELPLLFGDANIRLFAHASKFVDADRLVTEDGNNAYVTDRNIYKFGALPVVFLHGRENELFHYEGAQRSAEHWHRVHAHWAELANKGVSGGSERGAPAWIVDDYGHVDVLVGQDARRDIYEPLSSALDCWHTHKPGRTAPDKTRQFVRASLPLSGPFIGAVRRDTNGAVIVSISFRIDDRIVEGSLESNRDYWAFARYRRSGGEKFERVVRLDIHDSGIELSDHKTALRMASGEVVLADIDPNAGDIEIECFSVHKVRVSNIVEPPDYAVNVAWEELSRTPIPQSLNDGLDLMLERLKPELFLAKFDNRIAVLRPSSVQALASSAEQRPNEIRFGVGGCRYPGFRFEHRRVDNWVNYSDQNIDFSLLLGDQIYADYTAGFTDELSPEERYIQRHRFAFARNHRDDGKTWFGDWLARHPVIMTPDDHEFMDGYPDGPQLVPASRDKYPQAQESAHSTAHRALVSYQQQQIQSYKVPGSEGAWQFNAGPARFLVLDTRSFRRSAINASKNTTILTDQQVKVLREWVKHADALKFLNVLVTGSVLLPGLSDHDDPANPGRRDNFQANSIDRDEVFEILDARCEEDAFRFLLISGDYHLSSASEVLKNGRKIGAALVSPPLYQSMPFMNLKAHGLWWSESLKNEWKLSDMQNSWPGSGLGHVTIKRQLKGSARYEVNYSGRLWQPEIQDVAPGTKTFDITISL